MPVRFLTPMAGPVLRGTLLVAVQRGLGQGLVFLATLLAARHVAPAEMGRFGLIVSIGTLAGMTASLRIEMAALRCRAVATRHRLIGVALGTSLTTTACVALGLVGAWLLGAVDTALLWVPVIMLASSWGQAIVPAQWTGAREITRLGLAAQVAAAASAAGQVAAALVWPSAATLAGARALGLTAGLLVAGPALQAGCQALGQVWRLGRSTRRALRLARGEILLGNPAALLSVLSAQVPVYVFSAAGRPADAGAFWLAFNLLLVPYQIVAGSFRPLFLRRVAGERDPVRLRALLGRATLVAAIIGVVGCAGAAAAGHLVIGLALGPRWAGALPMIDGLAVMLAGLVLQTPVSAAIPALRLQGLNLATTAAQATLRAALMVATLAWTASASLGVAAFSLAGLALSLIQAWAVLAILRRRAAPLHTGTPRGDHQGKVQRASQ